MRFALLALLLTIGLWNAAPAAEDTAPEEQVKQLLRSAIEDSKRTRDYGTQILIQLLDSMEGRGPVAISVFGAIRTAPSEYHLTAMIDEIEILSRSPQIQAACHTLRPKLRAEMEAQDAALAAKIRQGVTDAIWQGLDAKSAKDLDTPIANADSLLAYGHIHGEGQTYAATESARFLVPALFEHMQEVFAAAGMPTHRQWSDLNESLSNTTSYIPRSEYLDRVAQFRRNNRLPRYYDFTHVFHQKLLQLIRGISSPADMAKGLERLDGFNRFDDHNPATNGNALRETKEVLKDYQKIYLDLAEGRATQINPSTVPLVTPRLIPAFLQKDPPPEPLTSDRADIGNELTRLRDQLVLQSLPRVLGLTKPADAAESIRTYLQRITSEAQGNSDWDLLLRVLETKQTLHGGGAPETVDTISALRSFTSGLKQEQAQDYAAATQSFLEVLQTGSQVPPADLVGGHLGRLLAKHPQEFQQAISRLGTPSSERGASQYSVSHLLYQQATQRPKSPLSLPPTVLNVPAITRAK